MLQVHCSLLKRVLILSLCHGTGKEHMIDHYQHSACAQLLMFVLSGNGVLQMDQFLLIYVLGAIVVRGCCDFMEIGLFYDLKTSGISPYVFIYALYGYSINFKICLVYDEIFSSSPEKWNILHNKTNEIRNLLILLKILKNTLQSGNVSLLMVALFMLGLCKFMSLFYLFGLQRRRM